MTAASVAAVVACTRTPRPQVGAPVVPPGSTEREEIPPVATQAGNAPRSVVVAPPPVELQRLAPQQIDRVVQPFWSPDSARVLFYDQPAPDAGGTWSVDIASGTVQRERADWGTYLARGALLAIPLPNERQTWVKHLGAGTEWALPTSGATVFSPDATLVAFASAGSLTVAGADGQGAQRLRMPLNGATVLSWLPGANGTPNTRLLLHRARRGEEAGLWTYDVQTGRLWQLARSPRIPGYLLSPDGSWLAHISMWNSDPNENGLWITRTDGSFRRRVPLMGSSRWTPNNRLLIMPARASAAESHQLWEVHPQTGIIRQLVGPEQAQFRVANGDWDVSPDGTQIVFVSADDRGLWRLSVPSLPENARNADGVVPPQVSDPPVAGSGAKPYQLPFEKAAGPDGWYVSQWYGVTTAGYRWRISSYGQGQGIHFGIDFAAPMRTPVVAVAPGQVIAVDGDYGSAPHNVVLELFDGNQAVYGHLAERSTHVQVGQAVEAGQVIGVSGDSGAPYDGSRNPHLHLEIRKRGRTVATNPVPFIDAAWDDFTLGIWNGALFERDLDHPRRNQFLDEQPDIRFGGPIITNFSRPWPI